MDILSILGVLIGFAAIIGGNLMGEENSGP